MMNNQESNADAAVPVAVEDGASLFVSTMDDVWRLPPPPRPATAAVPAGVGHLAEEGNTTTAAAAGVPEQDVVEILDSMYRKKSKLRKLTVAITQHVVAAAASSYGGSSGGNDDNTSSSSGTTTTTPAAVVAGSYSYTDRDILFGIPVTTTATPTISTTTITTGRTKYLQRLLLDYYEDYFNSDDDPMDSSKLSKEVKDRRTRICTSIIQRCTHDAPMTTTTTTTTSTSTNANANACSTSNTNNDETPMSSSSSSCAGSSVLVSSSSSSSSSLLSASSVRFLQLKKGTHAWVDYYEELTEKEVIRNIVRYHPPPPPNERNNKACIV